MATLLSTDPIDDDPEGDQSVSAGKVKHPRWRRQAAHKANLVVMPCGIGCLTVW